MKKVDISEWQRDEENSPYPEGARDKYALISPPDPDDQRIIPNHRYLLKFSNKRYPIQFWSELIACDIAKRMGVTAPPTFYAEDKSSGEPASLVEWFYGAAIESEDGINHLVEPNPDVELSDIPDSVPSNHSLYVSGGSYMVRHIRGYDLKKGSQHNFTTIRHIIITFRKKWGIDYWEHWVKTLLFDSVIGNTDRHQDNWGILWRNDVQGQLFPRFSPAFDNGTSLLHEIVERKLPNLLEDAQASAYINRGRHHIKWELEDVKPIRHLEMVKRLAAHDARSTKIILDSLDFMDADLEEDIHRYVEIDSLYPISRQRAAAISNIVLKRISLIRESIEH